MKNFWKCLVVGGVFLISFLGNYLKGAKRNLNHIGHTVQNYEFAGSARVWRNNYFNYKNSEEKKKELGKNNNEVGHEVKTEKPKTSEQICTEECRVELDSQKCIACLHLRLERLEKESVELMRKKSYKRHCFWADESCDSLHSITKYIDEKIKNIQQ